MAPLDTPLLSPGDTAHALRYNDEEVHTIPYVFLCHSCTCCVHVCICTSTYTEVAEHLSRQSIHVPCVRVVDMYCVFVAVSMTATATATSLTPFTEACTSTCTTTCGELRFLNGTRTSRAKGGFSPDSRCLRSNVHMLRLCIETIRCCGVGGGNVLPSSLCARRCAESDARLHSYAHTQRLNTLRLYAARLRAWGMVCVRCPTKDNRFV